MHPADFAHQGLAHPVPSGEGVPPLQGVADTIFEVIVKIPKRLLQELPNACNRQYLEAVARATKSSLKKALLNIKLV